MMQIYDPFSWLYIFTILDPQIVNLSMQGMLLYKLENNKIMNTPKHKKLAIPYEH